MTVKEKIWGFLLEGLWTEGLRVYFVYRHSWFKGAVLFSIILIFLNLLAARFTSPLFWGIVSICVLFLEVYYFLVCYLQQEPIGETFHQDWRQLLPVSVCVLLLTVASEVTDIIFPALEKILTTQLAPLLYTGADRIIVFGLIIFGGFIGNLLFAWIITRFLLAPPLAMSNMPSPIAASWKMTKGKGWRLLANLIMLSMMVGPIYFIIDKINIAPLMTVFSVFATGLLLAFVCASARILNGEYVAAHLDHDRRAAPRES